MLFRNCQRQQFRERQTSTDTTFYHTPKTWEQQHKTTTSSRPKRLSAQDCQELSQQQYIQQQTGSSRSQNSSSKPSYVRYISRKLAEKSNDIFSECSTKEHTGRCNRFTQPTCQQVTRRLYTECCEQKYTQHTATSTALFYYSQLNVHQTVNLADVLKLLYDDCVQKLIKTFPGNAEAGRADDLSTQ